MSEIIAQTHSVKKAARPGRPRSAEATATVLDAAYRLIVAKGLRGATIQAIADETGVSKMTIYKWWDNRLHLLIDAFLRKTNETLALAQTGSSVEIIYDHAARYVLELQGELGRVQLAVLAECLAETGNSSLFVARYLRIRRDLGIKVIKRGQENGEIAAARPAQALYDQIYGTIFYRSQFGLEGLDRDFVRSLVDETFAR